MMRMSGGGDFYEVSVRKILYEPIYGMELVQADIDVLMRRYGILGGHAWIEVGDWVYDTSNSIKAILGIKSDIDMPKKEYYSLIKPRNIQRYNPEQARKLLVKHGHYGPW